MREMSALVGGEWIAPGDQALEVINPADEAVMGVAPSLSVESVDPAFAAAVDVAESWKATPPVERASVLASAARILASWEAEVVDDLIAEGGKTSAEARGEFQKSVATLLYYAGIHGALDGRGFTGSSPSTRHDLRREPVGPVVAISPWNVPLASPARKLAPALLAGNPVLVKPASQTPFSAYHLVRALVSAGVPAGAVQLLTGPGSTVGARLVEHPAAAAVSFTGSTGVGKSIGAGLDSSVRVQLELGGKNAAVVLEDADLERAAGRIVADAFGLAGQQCTATSRVLAARPIVDELTARIVERASEIRVGGDDDGSAPIMGPLIDQSQVDTVAGFVERAMAQGARRLLGGSPVDRKGYFYPPTVLDLVKRDMEIAREEVFGPVLSIIAVDDDIEAIAVLNDTRYGLVSSVHTDSLARAEAFATGADTGIVSVNGRTSGIDLAAPFGGFKDSGTASKEHGPESLDFYTRIKLVSWTS